MNFLKHSMRWIVGIICLGILGLVLWFCLFGTSTPSMPEGTLVEWSQWGSEVYL